MLRKKLMAVLAASLCGGVFASDNLIKNGTFEGTATANTWGSYANGSGFSCANWTFHNTSRAGLGKPNGTWMTSGLAVGTYALFIQTASGSGTCKVSQDVSLPGPGTYLLAFKYTSRPQYNPITTKVLLGSQEVGSVNTTATTLQSFSKTFSVTTGGTQTFAFSQDATSNDRANVFEGVELYRYDAVVDGTNYLSFAAGMRMAGPNSTFTYTTSGEDAAFSDATYTWNGNLPKVTVPSTLTVSGAVKIAAYGCTPGTYTLLEANAITFADGATLAFDDTVTDSLTRTLTTEDNKIILTIARKDVADFTECVLNGSFDLPGTQYGSNGSYAWSYTFTHPSFAVPGWGYSLTGGLSTANNTWLKSGQTNGGTLSYYVQNAGYIAQTFGPIAEGVYRWSYNVAQRPGNSGSYIRAHLVKDGASVQTNETDALSSTTFINTAATVAIPASAASANWGLRLQHHPPKSGDISVVLDDISFNRQAVTGWTIDADGVTTLSGAAEVLNGSYVAGAATLAADATPALTLRARTPALTVAGTLTVAGPVVVTLTDAATLGEGAYTLFQAQSIAYADGAAITLDSATTLKDSSYVAIIDTYADRLVLRIISYSDASTNNLLKPTSERADTLFATASNWSRAHTPDATDANYICYYPGTLHFTTNFSDCAQRWYFRNGLTEPVVLTANNATNGITSTKEFLVCGGVGQTGWAEFRSGTYTCTYLHAVGNNGSSATHGRVDFTGATVVMVNCLQCGYGEDAITELNLTDGTVTVEGDFNSTILAGSRTTFKMTGGTFTANNMQLLSGLDSRFDLFLSGGTMTVKTALTLGYNSTGSSGLIDLAGGRLAANTVITRGDVKLLADGGAFSPYSDTTTWCSSGTLTVADGAAAILDTDGKNATFAGTLVDAAGGNAFAVTKRGRGTLTFASAPSFTGALRIEGGTLAGRTDWQTSSVTIAADGTYSTVDGAVASTAHALPALTLAGGAHLAFEANATAADTFTPASLDISAASASDPVILDVTLLDVGEIPEDAELCVLTQGLAAGDAAKFKVMGVNGSVVVKNGALYLTKNSRTTVAVEWSGAADDGGKWSTGANWTGDAVPENGDTAIFNLADGGTTLFDATGLAFGAIRFGATAGAFTETGDETLRITGAITNLSENTQTFQSPLALGVAGGTVTIDTTGDLILTGTVATAGTTLVKTGAGTLGVNDSAVLSAHDINVDAGVLRIDARSGDGAAAGASQEGTIRVADGARLDVNLANASATLAQVEATHGKTVEIAGAGPDGEGALYNSTDGTGWCAQLGKVVLTGDATVGGGHASVRPATGSLIPDATLEGPHTLTVKTTKATDGFNLHTIKLDVDEIDVVGKLMFEGTATGVVSNGIHLADDSVLRFYAATLPSTIPLTLNSDATATVIADSVDAAIGGPVTIETGATLNQTGSKSCAYWGAITNNGSFTIPSMWAGAFGPKLVGTGSYTVNGHLILRGNIDSPETTPVFAGTGTIHLESGTNAFPILGGCTSTFTGTVSVEPSLTSTETGNVFAPLFASAGTIHWFDGTAAVTTTVENATWTFNAWSLGPSSKAGKVVLGNGTTLTTGNLYIQDTASPGETYLEVGPGATLNRTASNNGFQIARVWQAQGTRTRSESTVRVNGGTINAPGTTILVGVGGCDGWLDLVDGALTANGFDIYHSTTWKANWQTASHHRFTQSGGRLALGAYGIRGVWPSLGNVHADLANGTLVANGNIANGYAYTADVFGADPRGTGDYTVDLNGKTVTWNGLLAGASDVTITGAGSFSSTVKQQSIPLGKWTITNTTSTILLTGAAGFPGGLTLAPGTSASVDIATTGLMEYGFFSAAQFNSSFDTLLGYDGPLAGTVNEMREMAQYYASEGAKTPGNNTMGIARGEFEVPADKAGTWYFAGNTDDQVALIIDGTTVLKSTSWTNIATGSKELTAGWHTFRVCTFDATGASGPAAGDWKDSYKLVGWTTDAAKSGSTTAADYTRFDTDTLNMRIPQTETARTGVRVSVKGAVGTGNATTYNTGKDAYAAYEFVTNTMVVVNGHSSQSTVFTPACGTNVRTEGFFHVDAAQTGDWTFTVCYDDRITLDIDGTRLVESTSWQSPQTATRTLAAGWHAFTIYTYDGSTVATGGFGATTKDDDNVVCAVKVKAAGAAKTLAFNGANFKIAENALQAAKHVETAGLGGVTDLGAGATLLNGSKRGSCPITGTLKGAGALSGPFAFSGTNSTLAVEGVPGKLTVKPDFTAVTDTAYLKGLAKIEATFVDGKAGSRAYAVAPAGSLTADEAAAIAVRVTQPNGSVETDWHATVVDDQLTLINPRPSGCVIYLR